MVVGEAEGGIDGEELHGEVSISFRSGNVAGHLRTYAALWTERVRDLEESELVDTTARLLRLLVLFTTRPAWSAAELIERLDVTDRTLRRDVGRLRDLGYPVESVTGRYGGYRLGAGGHLPPLLLDDDEAVAVSVALRALSRTADPALGEAALAALTKLSQVLPSALRERVDTLAEFVIDAGRTRRPDGARFDSAVLMELAQACRRADRLRFEYRTGDERTGRRHVEPHRLVSLGNRWYLVAFDLDRDDWRTFRIDRISGPQATGARAVPREAPDAAALVSEGVAVRVYETRARIRIASPPAEVAREIGPNVGVIEPAPADAMSTVVRLGGDLDWLARYIASYPCPVEVLEPDEVRSEVRRLARRLLREHAPTGASRPAGGVEQVEGELAEGGAIAGHRA